MESPALERENDDGLENRTQNRSGLDYTKAIRTNRGATTSQVKQANHTNQLPTMVKQQSPSAEAPDRRETGADSLEKSMTESERRIDLSQLDDSWLVSLRYSLNTVLWLFYHSIVLAFAPVIIMGLMFGSVWFFQINNQNILLYLIVSNLVFYLSTYFTIFVACLYVFGKKRVIKLLYRLTIPFSLTHTVLFALREWFAMPILIAAYYSVFLAYCILMIWNVRTKQNENQSVENTPARDEAETRFDVLSRDGTPAAVFQGFIPFFIIYFLSSFYLIPYFMNTSILPRLMGRVVLFPFIFNIADTYQNNLLLQKSKNYTKYRIVFGNIMNLILLTIVRLLIVDSPNLTEVAIMAVASSVSEIALRITFIPRSFYMMRTISHLKAIRVCPFHQEGRVENFNDDGSVLPFSSLNASVATQSDVPLPMMNHNSDAPRHAFSEEVGEVQNETTKVMDFFSVKRIRGAVKRIYEIDHLTHYILIFRSNRLYFVSMSELQMIIYIPIILFLCHPMQGYLTYRTFANVEPMFLSILVQFPIELVTQVISLALEKHLYGIEIPVQREWKYSMKPFFILQSTLISISIIFLSTNPFWINTENWASD